MYGEGAQTRELKGRLNWAPWWVEPSLSPWVLPLQIFSSFHHPLILSRLPSVHSSPWTSPYQRFGSLWVVYFQSSCLWLRWSLLGLRRRWFGERKAWPEQIILKQVHYTDPLQVVVGQICFQEQWITGQMNCPEWPSPSSRSVEQLHSHKQLPTVRHCFAWFCVN